MTCSPLRFSLPLLDIPVVRQLEPCWARQLLCQSLEGQVELILAARRGKSKVHSREGEETLVAQLRQERLEGGLN